MSLRKSPEFFTHGDHSLSLTIEPPIRCIKGSQGAAAEILHAITDRLTAHAERVSECIEYALELDYTAYSVYISGAVVELPCVDGTHSGYALSISIFPRATHGVNEADG